MKKDRVSKRVREGAGTSASAPRASVELAALSGLESISDAAYVVFENALRQKLEERRPFFVQEAARRIRELRLSSTPLAQNGEKVWVGVESLSKLRALVGGRFENLKKKWIGAGFPLKEHRGDKTENFTVIPAGWLEMSEWIMKQGFEARLTSDSADRLFELRKL